MKTKTQKWPAIVGAALLAANIAEATDLVWIGGTGNWNAAGNWSPAQIPGAADNAFLTNNGSYTVSVPDNVNPAVGSLTLGGGSGTQILSLGRSILTLNGSSTVNANGLLGLTVANSTVTGPGSLTVNGTLNWANGTMSGAGTTTIGSGGVLAIGSGGVTLGRTLNNSGTGTWSGGNLTLSANNAFNNLVGGTFDITADGRLSGAATTPINNSGRVRLTAGTAGTFVTAPFTNSGALQVLASTLNLNLGGVHTGTISNAPGATLNFGGGTHLLGAGSFVTGGGVVSVSGGATVLTASGTFDVGGTTLSLTAGTATLTAGCNVAGTTLNVGGGVLVFNSSGAVGAVNLTAGTLGGISPVSVTGPLTLGGGTVTNALVTANGGLTINGNVTLNGTKLVNPVTAVWSAGNFNASNGAVISNLFGATFTNTFDGNMNVSGATPLFVNAGAFRKTGATAAAGTTSIDAHFINTGTVEVQTNTLRYAINEQTAGLTLLNGGNLLAQAQPLQFLGGSLVGTGLVTVANAQNVINSAAISPGLSPGELDIVGNYQQTSSGALNIELGGLVPGTGFDLVTVTAGGAGGVATLGGTLNVTLINGFSPAKGATFTFLTAVSRVGAFATFNYPSNDIGMTLSYDATSAKVTVSNLKPVVANPISSPAPITYGSAFNFQFPANTFSDPDDDTLTYSASGMPAGITFTGATRTFSGTPTQAGAFTVTVVGTDNGTPSLSVTNTFTITITPADITGNFTAGKKTYDGTTTATVLTRTLNGVLLADQLNVSLTGGTATFADAAKGTGKTVTLAGATLTGSAAGNYNLTSVGTTTANITALDITGNFTAGNKTYDGTTAATVLTRTLNGVLLADQSNVNLTGGTATFADAAKGTGKTVTLTGATLTGTAAGNYNLTSVGTTTANVAAAALSVTADNKTKTVGAADPPFTASYAGFVNGETPAVLGGTLTFTRDPGETVGSYVVRPSGVTNSNYTITFNTGILTITPVTTAPVILSLTGAGTPNILITWSAVSNTVYRVQYVSDLSTTNWTELIGDVIATGSTASKTDVFTTTNRFYRVRVLP